MLTNGDHLLAQDTTEEDSSFKNAPKPPFTGVEGETREDKDKDYGVDCVQANTGWEASTDFKDEELNMWQQVALCNPL